jgi:hypothetical protein
MCLGLILGSTLPLRVKRLLKNLWWDCFLDI